MASEIENATGGSAAGSNRGELGGIGSGADTAIEANTLSMSDTRSIACRRAVRTFGSRNSGWFGRRLSRTAVSVEPGYRNSRLSLVDARSDATIEDSPDDASMAPAR